ncbi:MAG: WD40 repeat domain-containing protein [Verrucomicrobiales bacterium]|nr:WD40 repeat domain-containing protein [Verrucomicrobiales bacterium]
MSIRKALHGLGVALSLGLSSFSQSDGAPSSMPLRTFGLGEVRLLAVSADLRFLASAGQAGAYLWNTDGSRLRHRLTSAGPVSALAFSPDGGVLLTAHTTVILAWDTESGTLLKEFRGHGRGIARLQFAPDGMSFASAGEDNTARVWSWATGAEMHSFEIRGSPIGDVAIAPDGLRLVTVDTFLTNSVKIWDLRSDSLIRALPMTNQTAQRCAFSPAGDLLTVAADRQIVRWNAESGEILKKYEGIVGQTTMIHEIWFPNDFTLAATCNDGSVYLWNLEQSAPVKVVAGEANVFSSGVRGDFLVAVANLDSVIRIRQLPSGDTLREFVGHTTSTHAAVAFSPDGRFVLSGGTEAATRLWDRNTGGLVRTFTGSPAGTMAATFSTDGSRILTTVGLPNPGARLWKTETGEIERDFRWTGSWPSSAAISKDGTRVAAGAQDGRIRLFDAGTGALVRTMVGEGWMTRLAFSPTAPLLASGEGGLEYRAALYNYESGQRLHDFPLDAGPVTAVAFSPAGDLLMVGWQDGVIRLYNAVNLELRQEWVTKTGFLDAAAFSPDGRTVITGESFPNFVATLWDVRTGHVLRSFRDHYWVIGAVAFDPSGTRILTGAEVVREWSVADLAAQLRIDRFADHSLVHWSRGQLQHAATLAGPWMTLTNAVSPHREASDKPAGYYRVQVE